MQKLVRIMWENISSLSAYWCFDSIVSFLFAFAVKPNGIEKRSKALTHFIFLLKNGFLFLILILIPLLFTILLPAKYIQYITAGERDFLSPLWNRAGKQLEEYRLVCHCYLKDFLSFLFLAVFRDDKQSVCRCK